jgi:hypothetical protein
MSHAEPASLSWQKIVALLDAEGIAYETDLLVGPARAVGLKTRPIVGLVIGKDGDVEVQVQHALVQWFPPSALESLLTRTLPELLAAVRAERVRNKVVRDDEGFIREAETSFAGEPPAGLERSYRARYSKQVRHQNPTST